MNDCKEILVANPSGCGTFKVWVWFDKDSLGNDQQYCDDGDQFCDHIDWRAGCVCPFRPNGIAMRIGRLERNPWCVEAERIAKRGVMNEARRTNKG